MERRGGGGEGGKSGGEEGKNMIHSQQSYIQLHVFSTAG